MQRIIFFDGVCLLCNRFVTFVFNYDKKRYFKYASLQSKTAAQMLSQQDLRLDSIVYLEDNKTYRKSKALIKILFQLGGLWQFFARFISIIPIPVRDFIYTKIALNRYKIFGQSDTCRIPTSEEKKYFLE